MKLSNTDLEWIRDHFPELSCQAVSGTVIAEGLMFYDTAFDPATKTYYYNADQSSPGVRLSDAYQVRIEVPVDGPPAVHETAGRIPAISDRHKYIGSTKVCAWGPLDTPSTVTELFSLALQYFYDQTYFERFGYWPRGEFDHGAIGILQNYTNAKGNGLNLEYECLRQLTAIALRGDKLGRLIFSNATLKGHYCCICGSGKPFRKCHPDVLHAIWELRKYIPDLLISSEPG